MATWQYLSTARFQQNGASGNYQIGDFTDVAGPSFITDENADPPDGAFEVNEVLISQPNGDTSVYTGFSLVDTSGNEYVFAVTGDTAGNPIGIVYAPVDAATADGELPRNLNESDVTEGSFTVCFAAGTGIATPDGERAVESLAIGDMILTQDGRAVPVKWIGRQTLHKLFTPADRFAPVRVAAGALGNSLPHTDLVLTADHALILDGLAINAGALVNGTTIAFEPVANLPERVTYYHIETEDHDVILANGAAAETYVDYIGRRAFDNFAEYTAPYGDERDISEMPLPRVSADRLVPPAIRERLADCRAA